ncbi:hypothetical protein OF83DRAFT_1061567 [Amylostereum chailletii]|nr:hypothetical protein OF83DRAFT_1061567 [Amylostereum chailletii]
MFPWLTVHASQPTHNGQLVQLGWNAGPRHAHIWGLAVSYTARSLEEHTYKAHDQDAVAALSLAWAFVDKLMPAEIVEPVDRELEALGMPRMATRHVGEGPGWRFVLDSKTYEFPLAERAPPEGYMAQGYTSYASLPLRGTLSEAYARTL